MIITTRNAHVPSSSLALFSYLLSPKKFLVYLIQENKRGCFLVWWQLILHFFCILRYINHHLTVSSPFLHHAMEAFHHLCIKPSLLIQRKPQNIYALRNKNEQRKPFTIYVQNRACLYKEDLKHIRIMKRKRTISQF